MIFHPPTTQRYAWQNGYLQKTKSIFLALAAVTAANPFFFLDLKHSLGRQKDTKDGGAARTQTLQPCHSLSAARPSTQPRERHKAFFSTRGLEEEGPCAPPPRAGGALPRSQATASEPSLHQAAQQQGEEQGASTAILLQAHHGKQRCFRRWPRARAGLQQRCKAGTPPAFVGYPEHSGEYWRS